MTFVLSAVGIAVALLIAFALPMRGARQAGPRSSATLRDIKGNGAVWAGWIVSASGLLVQGVVFTFFPPVGHERGLTPAAIGLVFGTLGVANTLARFPAGWLIDRTGRYAPYAIGGVLLASLATALLPHIGDRATLLVLAALFGAVSGVAFVAIGVALAAAASPATRGLVMGGYSTSLYLGLALGSFACGPVITRLGYAAVFAAGGTAAVIGSIVAALLGARGGER